LRRDGLTELHRRSDDSTETKLPMDPSMITLIYISYY